MMIFRKDKGVKRCENDACKKIHSRQSGINNFKFIFLQSMQFVGFWLKVRGKGQGCVAVWYLTPYFGYFILPPRCLALPKKVPKRIIQKKKQQQIRDEDVSFILSFIHWVQQPLHGWGSFSWIHWNGWTPQLRGQKYVNHFMYVFVLIWYFGLP